MTSKYCCGYFFLDQKLFGALIIKENYQYTMQCGINHGCLCMSLSRSYSHIQECLLCHTITCPISIFVIFTNVLCSQGPFGQNEPDIDKLLSWLLAGNHWFQRLITCWHGKHQSNLFVQKYPHAILFKINKTNYHCNMHQHGKQNFKMTLSNN